MMENQTLGRYQVGERVGTGRNASVYRVQATAHQVIKVLPVSLSEDISYPQRFDREMERTAQLEHPAILPLVDYGVEKGISYVVMPWMQSGSLAERMAAGKALPISETLSILRRIAQALEYAHTQGVVHGDVHSGNILFDEDGNAVLSDFGLATVLQDTYGMMRQKRWVSDPAFLAPEVWETLNFSALSDIYALGVAAYQLLTGRLPFEASTPSAIEYQHRHEKPVPVSAQRPDLPPEVDAILAKVLAKDPAQRYRSAAAFVQALAELVEGEGESEIAEAVIENETEKPVVRRLGKGWWTRRVGCWLLIGIWFLLMLSPCLVITVLVQGEVVYGLSDKPGHELRIFKVQSETARGFGISLGTVERESDGNVCILTRVRYAVWRGDAEETNYCQCYHEQAGEWLPLEPVDNQCHAAESNEAEP